MSISGKSSEKTFLFFFLNHKAKEYAYSTLNQFGILHILGDYYTPYLKK